MLVQHTFDLGEEILDQRLGVLEIIGASGIAFRAMPMVIRRVHPLEARPDPPNMVGVIEAYQPPAIRSMQRE